MRTSKKVAIIAALVMIAAGIVIYTGAIVVLDADFTKINTISFVTNTYSIEEEFSDISVDGAECDIKIFPSEDGKCRVVCRESDRIFHSVSVEGDTLTIERHDGRRWYEHIGVYWGTMEIAIYLPDSEYENLFVKNLSGDIVIPEGFSFESAKVQSTSGNASFLAAVEGNVSVETVSGELFVGGISPDRLSVQSTSGKITVEEVTVKEAMEVSAVSGNVGLSGVRCQTLTTSTTSGQVDCQDVIAEEEIRMECVSGDIELRECDAGTLWLKTSSGNISGELLTEKTFYTETSSGDVDVPYSGSGGLCEVTTVSGDIEFAIP